MTNKTNKTKKDGKSPARTPAVIKKLDDDFKNTNSIINLTDIRTKDNLVYSYSQEEQDREFKLLQLKLGAIDSKQVSNKIVLSNQPHYYEVEKSLWKENKNNIRNNIVDNRKKHLDKYKNEYTLTDKDILRGFKISGAHIGFSHFNPLWIRWFIETYNIKTMYDPCGGWGHRLLGASKIDKYIYNDFDIRTTDGCRNIAKNHSITNAVFYSNDSSTFTPKEDYECVFTCPPYYNIETYNNKTFKNKKDYKNWWENTVKCSLKESVKYFVYIVNHTYYDILRDICEANMLVFKDEFIVGKKLGHFSRADLSKSKKTELLVVFDYNKQGTKQVI